jgi:hypothetical protein
MPREEGGKKMKRLIKPAIIIGQVFIMVMGKGCNTSATEILEHYPYLGANLPGN